MGSGSTTKRRRTVSESTANTSTPSRPKPSSGRGRGRPPNLPRDGRERPPSLAECFKRRCDEILDRLIRKDYYNIFLEPVNTEDVVGYADIIKNPMDFTTMRNKLARQEYKSLGEFRKDLDLIWSNCLLFNGKEPNNVFSKKAIELRRLTEKLIVSTRQQLEKDKELLNQWKEKHRRRKENVHNASTDPSSFYHKSSALDTSTTSKRTSQTNPSANNDSMDGESADELESDQVNGRTPEQNALAETLRLQYAGNSGLFKKSLLNLPPPQYTKPDGSVVEIPLTHYNPAENHWAQETFSATEARHHVLPVQLSCDSLPTFRAANSCQPYPEQTSMLVDDYISSVFQFAKKLGPRAIAIITDYLSPELMVKVQQDEWKKKGYSLPELAKQAEAARSTPTLPEYRPEYNWTADAIMELADDIERANKKSLSMLPKLPRLVMELEGLASLEKYLDKKLLKEVEDVSPAVIDFSMPHGVNLPTLQELSQLNSVPELNMNQREQASLEKMKALAENHIARHSIEQRSRIPGASHYSSSELHEAQVRAYAMKRQRRIEAERQATIMAQCYAGSPPTTNHVVVPSKRKREPDTVLNVQHMRRAAPHQMTNSQVNKRVVEQIPGKAVQHAQTRLQNPGIANTSPLHGRTMISAPNGLNFGIQNNVNQTAKCDNCRTTESPAWRAGAVRPSGVERLCLHCGAYWEQMGRHRPKELWSHVEGQRGRVNSVQNGRTNARVQANFSHSSALPSLPLPLVANGISKRSTRSSRSSPSSRQSPLAANVASKKMTELQSLPSAIGINDVNSQNLHKVSGMHNALHGSPQNSRSQGITLLNPQSNPSLPTLSAPSMTQHQNQQTQVHQQHRFEVYKQQNQQRQQEHQYTSLPHQQQIQIQKHQLQSHHQIPQQHQSAQLQMQQQQFHQQQFQQHQLQQQQLQKQQEQDGKQHHQNQNQQSQQLHQLQHQLQQQQQDRKQNHQHQNQQSQQLHQLQHQLQQQQHLQSQQPQQLHHQQQQSQQLQQLQQQPQHPHQLHQQLQQQLHHQQQRLYQQQQLQQQRHQQLRQQMKQNGQQPEEHRLQDVQKPERQQIHQIHPQHHGQHQLRHHQFQQQLLRQQQYQQEQQARSNSQHQQVPHERHLQQRSQRQSQEHNLQSHFQGGSQLTTTQHPQPQQSHQPQISQQQAHFDPSSLAESGVSNGIHRSLNNDERENSAHQRDMNSQLIRSVPMIGDRQMSLPDVTKPSDVFGSSGGSNGGLPDISAIRQSLAHGTLAGQGLFAPRNVIGGNATSNNNISQPRAGQIISSHTNIDAPKIHPSLDGQSGTNSLSGGNNMKVTVSNGTPYSADTTHKDMGSGNLETNATLNGPQPSRLVSQGFRGAEVIGNFGGGDNMFDHVGSSNGDVAGTGNIDGGLFFDDGDLAAASAGAPELEF